MQATSDMAFKKAKPTAAATLERIPASDGIIFRTDATKAVTELPSKPMTPEMIEKGKKLIAELKESIAKMDLTPPV